MVNYPLTVYHFQTPYIIRVHIYPAGSSTEAL